MPEPDDAPEPTLPDPEDDAAWDEHEQALQDDWDERVEALTVPGLSLPALSEMALRDAWERIKGTLESVTLTLSAHWQGCECADCQEIRAEEEAVWNIDRWEMRN